MLFLSTEEEPNWELDLEGLNDSELDEVGIALYSILII